MAVYDTYQLRFPEGMRDQLEQAAKKNNRSLHAELIDRLRASLDAPSLELRVTELERQVAQLLKGKR
jgi:hypothetical protein